MNKPLLLSLAATMLLGTTLSADAMSERFEAMEKEMQKLKAEIAELKSASVKATEAPKAEEEKKEKVAVASKGNEDSLEERLNELEEAVSGINRNTAGSHLKFQVDYRFAIENMDYEMADGSSAKNDAFMTNRL